jgi:choline dehydrogenase-like flavoprotein
MSDLVAGTPPPAPKKKMDVIRIVAQEPHTIIIVSDRIWGQPVHWFGRRSHECFRDRGDCQGCRDGWPCKWQGYLHVTRAPEKWEGFLEITATAWQLLLSQLPVGDSLRGLIIQVGRTKGGAKGRYLINVLERRIPSDQLPEMRDPLPTLRMLWRAKKGPLPDLS